MENKPTHIGIYIDDMERAKKFYANLFGWDFNSYGPSDFFQIKSDDELIGALQSRKYSPIEQQVIGYECTIEVMDIDRTIALILENGGNIVLPKTEIPSVGWVSKFLDTEGNLVCVMEYQKNL